MAGQQLDQNQKKLVEDACDQIGGQPDPKLPEGEQWTKEAKKQVCMNLATRDYTHLGQEYVDAHAQYAEKKKANLPTMGKVFRIEHAFSQLRMSTESCIRNQDNCPSDDDIENPTGKKE